MKITDMKLYHVPPRYLYLKIETDEGVCGWGEPLVEGRAGTLEGAVNEWRGYFIGKNPLLIEEHWQTMYRGAFYRGGPVLMSTIAGIDQALWDIKGKFHNMPVYEMLGGPVKNRVKVYRGIGGSNAERLANDAVLAKKQGYKLIKTGAGALYDADIGNHYIDSVSRVNLIVERIGAIRDAIGFEIDLGVDFHGQLHKPMAKVLARELDQFKLSFIEEPVLPENNEALREVAKYTSCPIATGERMYSRWDFKKLLSDGYVDIVQPDLSHAGGISECRRIGAMAEAYDVAIAPHCPLGAIALASCVQMDAATPNAVFQEQIVWVHDGSKENPGLAPLKDPGVFGFKDGYLGLPKAPGLGIEIDEALVEEVSKTPHNWKNPMLRTYDGSPIEW
ncbi:MAG: galactonate dehydratase [Oscillospiraceae bacterium]|nr:galactonate dehydratase [Oscillospiraceae bacterium]